VTRLPLQVLDLQKEKAKNALTTKERDYDRLVTNHALELAALKTAATASDTKQLELGQKLRGKDEELGRLRAELQVPPH
jgi:hypothetical protein